MNGVGATRPGAEMNADTSLRRLTLTPAKGAHTPVGFVRSNQPVGFKNPGRRGRKMSQIWHATR